MVGLGYEPFIEVADKALGFLNGVALCIPKSRQLAQFAALRVAKVCQPSIASLSDIGKVMLAANPVPALEKLGRFHILLHSNGYSGISSRRQQVF
jgi:hypothetical protein